MNLPEAEIGRRNLSGWIILAVLFALLIGTQLFGSSKTRVHKSDDSRYDIELKQVVTSKASAPGGAGWVAELKHVRAEVAGTRRTDPVAAEVYGLLLFEQGKLAGPADVGVLSKSSPAAFSVLTTARFSASQADGLAKRLPGKTFLRELLNADLQSKAGRPAPRQALDRELARNSSLEIFLLGCVSFGSLAAWAGLCVVWSRGSLKPKGLPNLPATVRDADTLAWGAAAFFGAYLVLLILSQTIAAGGEATKFTALAATLFTIVVYPWILRRGASKTGLGVAEAGTGSGSGWGQLIAIGLVGFLLEFPVSALMGEAGEKLFPGQNFVHPAESVLAGSHDVFILLNLFLLAAVQAPLYEETFFRGLLLPALNRVTSSLVGAIAVSSLLFASLHPQGVGAWLGLSTIAAAGCVLTYMTRSLAPTIVMHAAHNGFTLLLAYFML